MAPLHLGTEKGFFEEVGRIIEPMTAQTFAANVASVMNGDLSYRSVRSSQS